MTVARINSGQFLRIRGLSRASDDVGQNTFGYAAHSNGNDTCDLSQSSWSTRWARSRIAFSKFVKLLGRTKIKEGSPNLNASHELLQQVCEAHILAALIERTDSEAHGFDGLRGKVASGEWKQAVDSIV
jgi:hypothetical protein